MLFTGRLRRHYGSHPVTVVCAILLCLGVGLPSLTHSALAPGAALLVFGASYGGIIVAFNSAAVDLVAALRRPVMPSFHAAFGLGGMGLGALVAGSLSATRHLWELAAIGPLVTAVAGRMFMRIEPLIPADRGQGRGRTPGGPSRAARADWTAVLTRW
ncbi:hypothetical protein GCM10027162_34930 [Streptomyces incanus]